MKYWIIGWALLFCVHCFAMDAWFENNQDELARRGDVYSKTVEACKKGSIDQEYTSFIESAVDSLSVGMLDGEALLRRVANRGLSVNTTHLLSSREFHLGLKDCYGDSNKKIDKAITQVILADMLGLALVTPFLAIAIKRIIQSRKNIKDRVQCLALGWIKDVQWRDRVSTSLKRMGYGLFALYLAAQGWAIADSLDLANDPNLQLERWGTSTQALHEFNLEIGDANDALAVALYEDLQDKLKSTKLSENERTGIKKSLREIELAFNLNP